MEWSFPFLSIDGDRKYNDEDFSRFYEMQYRNGVFMPIGDGLRVKANPNGGMRVNVSTGAAMINGRIYFNSEDLSLQVPVASSSQDRTDLVVLRLDLNNRVIQLVYKEATTHLVRTEQIFELQLAEIKLSRNAVTVHPENIKDTRADEKVCGYSSPYEKVSVSGLESQYQDMLERAFESFQKSSADDLHILQTDFQNWFKNLQDQLTENQAGNLQNQLDDLTPNVLLCELKTGFDFGYENFVPACLNYWEYGLGTVPLEEQPEDISFDGTPVYNIPYKLKWYGRSHVKIYVPRKYSMNRPSIEKVEDSNVSSGKVQYRLIDGIKSINLILG